jgi:hypothetical protein
MVVLFFRVDTKSPGRTRFFDFWQNERCVNVTAKKMTHIGLKLDEIQRIKRAICDGHPYADRMSLPFALRLIMLKGMGGEDTNVLREVDFLEGLATASVTKKARQFKRQPLYPFWHKHFYAPRHFLPNIGARWGLMGNGNRELTEMITEVAERYGQPLEEWQRELPHRLIIDGWKDRNRPGWGLTGDWIIFAKHGGVNFYLDLATHEEGGESDTIMTKLRRGCATEFPFLFQVPPSDTD